MPMLARLNNGSQSRNQARQNKGKHMTIKIGDRLPAAEFLTPGVEGPEKRTTDDVFKGKKVVLFAVPGAFTPTCNAMHLPGYLMDHDALMARGVDTIACTAVNDIHVMKAWGKATASEGKIMMLADGNAAFAKACGLELNLDVANMGLRSSRYSMLVEDGVVKALNVETASGVNVSGSQTMLGQL
jgi:glutaredoxin/glutathione-dependent peroxiredoxin